MNERIKELRKALNLTQQEFADRICVSRGALAVYEMGRNEPLGAVIAMICREFSVNENWLRTGEGEMFDQQSDRDEIAAAVERLMAGQSADFKRRLVNALSTLKDEHWLVLEEKLKEIVAEQEPEPASSDNDIEQDVENYRRRRTLEKNPEEKSSPSNGDGSETA